MRITAARALTLLAMFISTTGLILIDLQPPVVKAAAQDPNATLPSASTPPRRGKKRHHGGGQPSTAPAGKAGNSNKTGPRRHAAANRNSKGGTRPRSKDAVESKILPAPVDTSPPLRAPSRSNPDADILLPDNFIRLEGKASGAGVHDQLSDNPLERRPRPERPLNTNGTFPEIANRRKVFVNVPGEYGGKITARLRAYGGLEIVRTAGEAEFAVCFYEWAVEKRMPPNPRSPLGEWGPETVRLVTGGTFIITIRDPSEHVPRVIWRKDDTDGGWFKRGDAVEKLTKRFVDELKKLRGEK